VLGNGRSVAELSLLNSDTLDAMFRPQFPNRPLDFGHDNGIGWMINGVRVPGVGPIAWHSGKYPGYCSFLAIARASGLGVVVLSNDQAADGFVHRVGEKALELAHEARSGQAGERSAADTTRAQRAGLNDGHLEEYAGNYVVFGQLTSVTVDKGHLSLEALGKRVELIPVAANLFIPRLQVLGFIGIPMSALSVRFVAIEGRYFAVLDGLPEPFPFARVEPRRIPLAWTQRIGSCHLESADRNLDIRDVRLQIDGGMLVASAKLFSKVWGVDDYAFRSALTPVSDDEAVFAGLGNGEGGTVKSIDDRHGHTTLIYSGLRFSCQH